jgi:HD-like signal output (HDOD) protein
MDAWVNNDALKSLASSLSSLPSMPSVYFDILKSLESPDTTVEQVGATIARDAAMTAKMLQLVNSAFFGLHRQLTDPAEAVMQLGLETIKSLVLGIHVFSQLESHDGAEISARQLWHHSLATAATARRIAKCECQDKQLAEEAFTAGLLHDVGRLVLLANLPGPYAEALQRSRDERIPLWEAERAVFGACHAEVGGYLLSLVETAVFHHFPGKCRTRNCGALCLVHIANVLEQESLPGQDPSLLAQLDREYLIETGMWEHAEIWRRNPPSEKLNRPANEKNPVC